MEFTEYFDLIRPHREAADEAKRIERLGAINWEDMPLHWLLLALQHFAVMIDRFQRYNVEDPADPWLGHREAVHAQIMRRFRAEVA